MTTWAILSSNTTRDYAFSTPIASLFWRDVICHTPFCLLVGNWGDCARSGITLEAIRQLGIAHHMTGVIDGYETANVAQNVREHAAALSFDDKAWLLPTDADLWPLRSAFYHQHEGTNWKAVCYYSNGDHFKGKADVLAHANQGRGDFQTIPTCHVTMRAETWRELYDLSSKSVIASTHKTMDQWLKPKIEGKTAAQAGWESWMSDQRIVTERLCRADWFPDKALFVERRGHPPADRICRSNPASWDQPLDDRWVDAHIWKAPDNDANWPKLRRIIAKYMPQHLAWAEHYRQTFKASYVD